MKKHNMVGLVAIATLLTTGTGLDPKVVAEMFANLTWPQASVAIALVVGVVLAYLNDAPGTRAKLEKLAHLERTSVPPVKP